MHVLKYKDSQLSMFDFNKAKNNRKDFVQRVNELLGLSEAPSTQKMLDACLRNPEVFSYEQRVFIRQCILSNIDERELSERQKSYLQSLFNKIRN